MVNLGVVSSAGVLRTAAAGVTEVLLLALAEDAAFGSTDAAPDRRDGGLEAGGLTSLLPAFEGTRERLLGRAAEACGVWTVGGLSGLLRLSFSGILMVPALCATGTGAETGAGVGVDAGTEAGAETAAVESAAELVPGLGKSFCFFFCCVSGSIDGDAEVVSSNFLFFEGFFSNFGVGVNVGVAIVLIRSRAFVTESGLNRFFRLEVMAPS